MYALAGLVAVVCSAFRPAQAALLPPLARTPAGADGVERHLEHDRERRRSSSAPRSAALLLAATSHRASSSPPPRSHSSRRRCSSAGIRAERSRARAPTTAHRCRQEFSAGFTMIARARAARDRALFAAQTLVAGALNVLIVVTALELLDLGEAGVGYLNSAVGIGGLLGALVSAALVGRARLSSDFGDRDRALGHPDRADRRLWPEPLIGRSCSGVVGRREHARRRVRVHAAPARGAGRGAGPRLRRRPEPVGRRRSGSARSWRRSLIARHRRPRRAGRSPARCCPSWPRSLAPAERARLDAAPVPERELELLRGISSFARCRSRRRRGSRRRSCPCPVAAGEEVFRAGRRPATASTSSPTGEVEVVSRRKRGRPRTGPRRLLRRDRAPAGRSAHGNGAARRTTSSCSRSSATSSSRRSRATRRAPRSRTR